LYGLRVRPGDDDNDGCPLFFLSMMNVPVPAGGSCGGEGEIHEGYVLPFRILLKKTGYTNDNMGKRINKMQGCMYPV